MADIRDIQIAQAKRDEQLEPSRDFTLGVLVFVDSADLDAKVANRTDYVWVSEFNQPESTFQVLNRAVPALVGLQVKIGWPEKPPFERQILGVWDNIDNTTGYDEDDGGVFNSHPHGQSHQFPSESNPGTDPVLIYQPALQILKTTGNGSDLTVSVTELPSFRYIDDLKSFSGTTLDLTSSVPSTASSVRFVLVYLDAITNILKTVDGTEVPDLSTITVPEPVLPDAGIASAYVKLVTGQTSITTDTHVTDAREFLEPRESALESANQIGEILFSIDGVSFTAQLPLTNGNGWLVNDDGTLLVV